MVCFRSVNDDGCGGMEGVDAVVMAYARGGDIVDLAMHGGWMLAFLSTGSLPVAIFHAFPGF